jgi:hypothetical protein
MTASVVRVTNLTPSGSERQPCLLFRYPGLKCPLDTVALNLVEPRWAGLYTPHIGLSLSGGVRLITWTMRCHQLDFMCFDFINVTRRVPTLALGGGVRHARQRPATPGRSSLLLRHHAPRPHAGQDASGGTVLTPTLFTALLLCVKLRCV